MISIHPNSSLSYMENFCGLPCFDHWSLLSFSKLLRFFFGSKWSANQKHTDTLLNFVFIKCDIFTCLKFGKFFFSPPLGGLKNREHQEYLQERLGMGERHFIITEKIKTKKQPVTQFGTSISCQKFSKEAVVQQFQAKLSLRKYSLRVFKR